MVPARLDVARGPLALRARDRRDPGRGDGVGLTHHELCFGCGQANLFGLQMEVEPAEGGGVAGRFFVKQDHGGRPGLAHPGLVATALEETMSLALEADGVSADLESFDLRIESAVPLGTFVAVGARVGERDGDRVAVEAWAELRGAEARPAARASARFRASAPASPSSRATAST